MAIRRAVQRAQKATRSAVAGTSVRRAHAAASSVVTSFASNVSSQRDVEDIVLTYGVPNAAIPDVVRPIAVVKVGGEVITKDIENLVSSLTFLKSCGILPVVIHGGGPQLNDELAQAGVKPEYIGGHRVTDAATMAVAKRVFEQANHDLAGALRAAGLQASQILGGVFRAEVHDQKLGLVGEIKSVVAEQVNACIARGEIPVLTSLGINGAGQTLNINADVAARELAISLKPMKVVFISTGGGWKEEGQVVAEVNIAQDYDRLANRDYTGRQGTLLKLNEMKKIVDKLPPSSSVTIASAAALASQLVPHRGPGTQIRRGLKVHRYGSLGSLDRTRLEQLFRAAGAPAAGALAYLDKVAKSPTAAAAAAEGALAAVFAAEDYSGAAIVTQPPGPAAIPVVHSMALTPLAYAEGTESALWAEILRAFPTVGWVAAPSSPVAEAAATVQKQGPAAIPAAFPPLSVARTTVHAQGTQRLSNGHVAMWTGVPAERAVAAIATLRGVAGVGSTPSTAAQTKPVAYPAPGSGPGKSTRVGLLGARGYTGREFLRLLANHPSLQLVCASSRALVGQDALQALGVPDATAGVLPGLKVSDVGPEQIRAGKAPEVDVWVLALPNGLCAEHASALDQRYGSKTPLLVDLSADMRFDTSGVWTYGMPERPGAREKIRQARKISNPGCYATGSQIALLPLLPQYNKGSPLAWDVTAKPHVFGVSGYSGAGTTPSDKNDPNKLRDNLLAYSLVNHIHEREVGFHCGMPIAFMPHVAPFFQGISLTVTGHLPKADQVTAAAIRARYSDFYANERLIRVLAGEKDMPDVRTHGTGQHGVTVGGFTYDPKTGRLALVSVIDNLLKGAATQALQNINLALGFDEYAGIPMPPK